MLPWNLGYVTTGSASCHFPCVFFYNHFPCVNSNKNAFKNYIK